MSSKNMIEKLSSLRDPILKYAKAKRSRKQWESPLARFAIRLIMPPGTVLMALAIGNSEYVALGAGFVSIAMQEAAFWAITSDQKKKLKS